MTPDLSLLLAHYASQGTGRTCACEAGSQAGLSPELARIAAQVAHLTGEERRLLALGAEVREAALALGQERHEAWVRDNPEAVASCRAILGQSLDDGVLLPGPPEEPHAGRVRLS